MKVNELLNILNEMPYVHDGKMKREPFKNTFLSDSSLERNYAMLGFVEARDEVVECHILVDDHPNVTGTIKEKHPEGYDSNRVVFSLRFKSKHTIVKIPQKIDQSRILQVDKVSIDKDFEGFGIASFVYAQLAKRGFLVLSDTSQFTDGKMLWKTMATKANLRNYKIFVLDDEYGFIKKDGEPVVYDGSNIDDAKIWSSGEDLSKEHTLLLMQV